MIELSIVVAAGKNGVIGVNNSLPWKLSADLQHFKRVTMGLPMIMGRLTFDSIGRPLPGRTTIVVTRQKSWRAEGVEVVNSLQEAIALGEKLAAASGKQRVIIAGGADLYKQALPYCHSVFLTRVEATIEGDAYFPELNPDEWEEVSRDDFEADGNNSYAYSFLLFKRKL